MNRSDSFDPRQKSIQCARRVIAESNKSIDTFKNTSLLKKNQLNLLDFEEQSWRFFRQHAITTSLLHKSMAAIKISYIESRARKFIFNSLHNLKQNQMSGQKKHRSQFTVLN